MEGEGKYGSKDVSLEAVTLFQVREQGGLESCCVSRDIDLT